MTKRKQQRGGLKPDRWLTVEQCKQLLVYIHDKAKAGTKRAGTNEIIVLILMFAGLRAMELRYLTIADTPFKHGKNELWVGKSKGTGGMGITRTVDISKELSRRITRYIRLYRKGAKPASPLICREGGCRRVREDGLWVYTTRLSYRSLLDRVRRIGRAAQNDRLTPHVLRHTYAMNLYRTKKDLLNVKDQLGHSSVNTSAIYARTDNTERVQQIEQMTGPLLAFCN